MANVWIEEEYDESYTPPEFDFDKEKLAVTVADAVLKRHGCPWDADVNLILTDSSGIRQINRDARGIDLVTDVLSFPVVSYDPPACWTQAEEDRAGSFDPDSGSLLLGDIVICADRVRDQARQYGHSEKREFAFLEVHSLLHLLGYDHMKKEEERTMFGLQEEILSSLGITRDAS